jgi:hypothetical protein
MNSHDGSPQNALKSIRVGPEKEAELIHSQRKERRWKNPDQNTMADNEGKLKLHAQPDTLAPSRHISHPSPPLFSQTHSRMHDFAIISPPPSLASNTHFVRNNSVWDKDQKARNLIRKNLTTAKKHEIL